MRRSLPLISILLTTLLLGACVEGAKIKSSGFKVHGDVTIRSIKDTGISFDAKSTTEDQRQFLLGHEINHKLRKAMNVRLIRGKRYDSDSDIKLWVSITGYRLEQELELHEVDRLSAKLFFMKGNEVVKQEDDITIYVKLQDVYGNKVSTSGDQVNVDITVYKGIHERVDDLVKKFADKIYDYVTHVVPETDSYGGEKGGFGNRGGY